MFQHNCFISEQWKLDENAAEEILSLRVLCKAQKDHSCETVITTVKPVPLISTGIYYCQ